MLFVDAGNNRIGIGNTGYNTTADLNLLGKGISFKNDVNGNNNNWSLIQCDITSDQANMKFISGSGNMEMTHGAGLVISPGANGYPFVFNETSKDCDFRVESDTNSHALFLDAGLNGLVFGTSSGGGQYNGTGSNGMAINTLGAAGQYVTIQNESDANLYLTKPSGYSDGRVLAFNAANVAKGSVVVDADGTTYNTTSDRRLKDNIEPISDGTEKLMAMKPVTHTWIADPEADAIHGFIAQEMQDIVPEAVSGEPDGEEMMSMDYGRITPVLVAALQDANNKIDALEKRLTELENK
jgi:hypothetical protein